jgi:hypothetical protein
MMADSNYSRFQAMVDIKDVDVSILASSLEKQFRGSITVEASDSDAQQALQQERALVRKLDFILLPWLFLLLLVSFLGKTCR